MQIYIANVTKFHFLYAYFEISIAMLYIHRRILNQIFIYTIEIMRFEAFWAILKILVYQLYMDYLKKYTHFIVNVEITVFICTYIISIFFQILII
jgi:hypothetical protein